MEGQWKRAAWVVTELMSHPLVALLQPPLPRGGGPESVHSSIPIPGARDLGTILDRIRSRAYANVADWAGDVEALLTRSEVGHGEAAHAAAVAECCRLFRRLLIKRSLCSLEQWHLEVTRLQDRLNLVLPMVFEPNRARPTPPQSTQARRKRATSENLGRLARRLRDLSDPARRELVAILLDNKEIESGWVGGTTINLASLKSKTITELQELVGLGGGDR
jgi:hypothetical protein